MEEKEVTNKKNITTDTTDNENIIEQLTKGKGYCTVFKESGEDE